jgi:hypothetical protein
MSNVVISPFYKSHPVFKADQVLSEVHLNDMLGYLDSENTQTRSQLIGTGIAGGFTFELSEGDGVITIRNGKGVTTAGQLIVQSKEGGSVSHSQAIPYDLANKAEEFPYLPENITIYALVPDHIEGAEELEGLRSISELLSDKPESGIAALQEAVEIHIESCFITNCDERGNQKKFAIKYLLFVIDGSVANEPEQYRHTTRRIERLSLPHVNNPDIAEAYWIACKNKYIQWIQDEVSHINQHLVPVLSQITNINNLHLAASGLKHTRDTMKADQPRHLQYFYDHLTDLGQTVIAINRLKEDLEHQLHTRSGHYPNHLMLGAVYGQNPAFARHFFQPVRTDHRDLRALQQLAEMCQKLGHMLRVFNVPDQLDAIQLIPTRSRSFPLADTAVPFYYNLPVRDRLWSGEHFMSDEKDPDQLSYYHDDKDMLLVEGLIGKTKNDALKGLSDLKKQHHLSFGLVALRISSTDHETPYPKPQEIKPGSPQSYNFKEFITEHPGLYHSNGVPKGGTLAVIFKAEPDETDGPVVATLALPYICCGHQQAAAEPEPFVLDAKDDQHTVTTDESVDITVLDNDEFDPHSPVEIDFVYDLTANDDQRLAITGKQIDIKALQNDLFDREADIEVDLLNDLNANDISVKTNTGQSMDIDVLKNDNISPGPIALDFDKDN